jgi:hypothetical protein
MPKRVLISSDDISYYTLPGNSGELRNEAGELPDTIFGQGFESTESGLLGWTLNSNALYKGFAGYIVKLMKGGTPIAMTAEAMTLVSGKTYRINAAAKRFIDIATAITVFDAAVNKNAFLENINFVTGEVTFLSSYTVTGAITITGAYVPTTAIGGARSFTLTQTAAALDNTDIPTAKANLGNRTFDPTGLKTVSLELSGVYKIANGFVAALQSRAPVYIEINPDNSDKSVARGIFKYTGQGQSGNVGALEEETVTLKLNVPQDPATYVWAMPFAWIHDPATTLSLAVQKALTAWQTGTLLYAKYLYDGTNGFKGQAAVTNMSLSGGLESMNEFTVNLQGSGAVTVQP